MEQNFTAHKPLLRATSRYGLERRCQVFSSAVLLILSLYHISPTEKWHIIFCSNTDKYFQITDLNVIITILYYINTDLILHTSSRDIYNNNKNLFYSLYL